MKTLPKLTIIPAGAGSGKTYTIQKKLSQWVREGKVRPERIVAVTFTEAAANELRERIRSALLADAKVSMEQVLGLDQAYICTIHSFGLRVIQKYCFEGGWSPLPRLLTEDEGDILVRQILAATQKADEIMADLARFGYQWSFQQGSAEDQFRSLLSTMMQKHRVIGIEGVKKKIKHHLLKTIKSLYGRTGQKEVLEKDLHTSVKKLLKAFPTSQVDLYPKNKSYVSDMKRDHANLIKAKKIKQLRHDWPLWVSLQQLRTSKRGSSTPEGYDQLAEEVMKAAGQLYRHTGPLQDALLHAGALVDTAQDCLRQHTELKRERGLVDYGDMLRLAHELLHDRHDVLQDFADKIDCVVIDEFQDTNPLQFSLLHALYRQNIPTLIVGDVKQAIMGFQDADHRLLEQLSREEAAIISPLKANWRTVKPLMKFLNAAGKGLFPNSYQELSPRVKEQSQLSPLHIITFNKYNGSHAFYADHVAVQVQKIIQKKYKVLDAGNYRIVCGSDIAVLLPTNALVEKYAESFRQVGLQVQVDESGWFESRSVQLLYYAFLFAADMNDRHAALYLSVTELGQTGLEEGIGQLVNGEDLTDPVLERISSLHKDFQARDMVSLTHDLIHKLDLFTVVSTWPESAQERANILRFLAEAEEFVSTNPETLEAGGLYGFGSKTFLAWLVKRAGNDNKLPMANVVERDAIQISTWHRAKGREWPIVAVCGTFKEYDAKVPYLDIQYQDMTSLDTILQKAVIEFSPKFKAAENNESFLKSLRKEAENNARRLLYVAMTRAKEQLILERAGHQEEKEKNSYWKLLLTCTEMVIKGKSVTIGKRRIKSTCTVIEENAVECEEIVSVPQSSLACLGLRAIQQRSVPATTMETLRPSELQRAKPAEKRTVTTHSYGKRLQVALAKDPAENGIILHRCFEVLTDQEDRTRLLEGATGIPFTKKQKRMLQAAVSAFETWCYESLAAIDLHKEVPVTYQNADGVLVSGFIDLLVETEDGYWIIDHKIRQPVDPDKAFWQYWPQLEAYRQGVGKEVLGLGVHWLKAGAVSLIG